MHMRVNCGKGTSANNILLIRTTIAHFWCVIPLFQFERQYRCFPFPRWNTLIDWAHTGSIQMLTNLTSDQCLGTSTYIVYEFERKIYDTFHFYFGHFTHVRYLYSSLNQFMELLWGQHNTTWERSQYTTRVHDRAVMHVRLARATFHVFTILFVLLI